MLFGMFVSLCFLRRGAQTANNDDDDDDDDDDDEDEDDGDDDDDDDDADDEGVDDDGDDADLLLLKCYWICMLLDYDEHRWINLILKHFQSTIRWPCRTENCEI